MKQKSTYPDWCAKHDRKHLIEELTALISVVVIIGLVLSLVIYTMWLQEENYMLRQEVVNHGEYMEYYKH